PRTTRQAARGRCGPGRAPRGGAGANSRRHRQSRRHRRSDLSVAPQRWDAPGADDGDAARAANEAHAGVATRPAGEPPPHPSRASLRGLDWFVFFVANVQAGFGPFINAYLTSVAWTQVEMGLVLSISSRVARAGKMPGGALVAAGRSERLVAAISVAVIGATALMLALWPIYVAVLGALVLHSAASCVLGPAMAAISLGLVGHANLSGRLGRHLRLSPIRHPL